MTHPDVLADFGGILIGPGLCCGWPPPDASPLRRAHELVPELMIRKAVGEFPKIDFRPYVRQDHPKQRTLALFGPDSPAEFEYEYSTEIRTHEDIDRLAGDFYRWIIGVGQSLTPLERVPAHDE